MVAMMKNEFLIRKARMADTRTLDAMLTELIGYETRYDSNLDASYQVQDNYARLVGEEGCALLVAEAEGRILGFLYGFMYQIPGMFVKPVALLDALFVPEPYRGRGIATALFSAFRRFAAENGACRIELKVMSRNENALHFYEKLSFQECKKYMTLDCL